VVVQWCGAEGGRVCGGAVREVWCSAVSGGAVQRRGVEVCRGAAGGGGVQAEAGHVTCSALPTITCSPPYLQPTDAAASQRGLPAHAIITIAYSFTIVIQITF